MSSCSDVKSSVKRRRLVGDFVVVKRIGAGSYATVWKGVHQHTGQVVAIKGVNRERMRIKKFEDNLDSEISIMKRLRHPNIVQLIDVHTTSKHIYLILEFCNGGDLSQLLKKSGAMKEEEAQIFLKQLASGLAFLNQYNLIHRDLKPQNLLLSINECQSTLKIADFGFARYIQPDSMAATMCGSPLYMAPEILRYQKYDAKADLWSIGTLLHEMLMARPPFTGKNHIQLLHNIETTEVNIPPELQISDSCRSLLLGLLQQNAIKRISLPAFFSHEFVTIDTISQTNVSPSLLPISNTQYRICNESSSTITVAAAQKGLPSVQYEKTMISFEQQKYPSSAPTTTTNQIEEISTQVNNSRDSHSPSFQSVSSSRSIPQPRTYPFKSIQTPRCRVGDIITPLKSNAMRRRTIEGTSKEFEALHLASSERAALRHIDDLCKSTVLVCSIGDKKARDNEIDSREPAEALIFYVKCYEMILRLRQAIRCWKSSAVRCSNATLIQLIKVDLWLAERSSIVANRANSLREFLDTDSETLSVEQLIYEHARQLARDAAVEELVGSESCLVSGLETSRALFQQLFSSDECDGHDRAILLNLISELSKFVSRLQSDTLGSDTSARRRSIK